MTATVKKPRLTKKEKGFVKDYLETGNGTQSALKNYDTEDENTAAVIASENLRKPKIAALIEEKLPDEELFQIHREGLYASREVWKNNNETKQIEHVSDEPDYAVRHKYLDSAYKLKGKYSPEPEPTGGNKTTYNFIFSKEVQADVKELEGRIKQKLINHVQED